MNFCKVILPKGASALLLEDSEMRIEWFKKRLPKLTVVNTANSFKDFHEKGGFADFIFLDHDLGLLDVNGNPGAAGNGYQAACYLADKFGSSGRFTLIHSWNKGGAARMQSKLPEALCVPFGSFEVEVEQ